MSDERSNKQWNTRQAVEATRVVSQPWVPRGLLNAVDSLRGTRRNGANQDRAIAAVLASPAAGPSSGEPPLIPFISGRGEARIILVAVFGLGLDELDKVVGLVEGQRATTGVVPIFLTDSEDFQAFRSRRLLFEYLPPPSQGARLAPDLDWDLYRQRRLALLRRKWQPARIVAFGSVAGEVVAAWRESPFEDGTIADVIVGGNGPASGLR